jgi:hypothetical protein
MPTIAPSSCAAPSWSLKLLVVSLLLACFVISLPGCGGCWQEDPVAKKKREEQEEKLKKKKKLEKRKPDFELAAPQVLPNEPPTAEKPQEKAGETRDAGMRVKPGHWFAASQFGKANNFDFLGELETYPMDRNNAPLEVQQTNTRVVMHRPASLPKGQAKFFETIYFLPRRSSELDFSYSLRAVLGQARGGGAPVDASAPLYRSLKDYEYFFVVLAGNANSYSYLPLLESVTLRDTADFNGNLLEMSYYRVSLPKIGKRAPLPSNALTWTTIAYVLWDDLDPAILTQEQQQAMLDWLHWGGQIIISGPNSLDKLKGSFLAPYLPAASTATIKLDQAAFDELNDRWSIAQKSKLRGSPRVTVLPEKPMLGIELKKHTDAEYIANTGRLLVERRVGGGRIVVTAFPLSDNRVQNWAYYDSFFNACLLRRPARKFSQGEYSGLQVTWADKELSGFARDPRMSSTLRYFTRDIGYLSGDVAQFDPTVVVAGEDTAAELAEAAIRRSQARFSDMAEEDNAEPSVTLSLHPDIDDWHFNGYHSAPEQGVAGWNDFSGAADAARGALREAAGIRIPQADFVLKVLGAYLLVLVPLNWLVFWLIGRVEWAWIATPLIAIAGSIAVIRMAQLDIGFARSRTEIAVLEVQGGYDRAHLTRYSALYTSLSTAYDLHFEDSTALVLPLASPHSQQRTLTATEEVQFRRDKQVSLSDVQVASNSAKMIHSEQMLDIDDPIELTGTETAGLRLKNNSRLTLRDAAVLRKTASGDIEVAYIEIVKPKTMVPLRFQPTDPNRPQPKEWDQSYVMSVAGPQKEQDQGQVRLYKLAELATRRLRLNPGDVRLVAWSSEDLPGMMVDPESAQVSTHAIVIAHLQRGQLPPAQPDENVSADFKTYIEEPDPDAPQVDPNGGVPAP